MTVLSPGPLVPKGIWQQETEINTALIKANGVPLPLIWIVVKDNDIPDHAVPFAKDHCGNLYIARALVEGELYLGRAARHLQNGALIDYKGRDYDTREYEVLACVPRLIWGLAPSPGGWNYQQGDVVVGKYSPATSQWMSDAARRNMILEDMHRVIPDGMVLDRAAKRREEAFQSLGRITVVFLVNDSQSMRRSHWDQVRDALNGMLGIMRRYGANGYELHLVGGEQTFSVQDEHELRKIFNTTSRKEDTYTAATLEKMLNRYIPLLDPERGGKVMIIVMTCDVAADQERIPSLVIEAARQLEMRKIPEHMFDVQFMQVGREQAATDALYGLSDHLKEAYMLRDIGDVTTFIPTKARFDAECLATVLAGGIHKDLDNLSSAPKRPVGRMPQLPPLPSTCLSPIGIWDGVELTPREVEKAVRKIVEQCAMNLPYRLLDVRDGTIHERNAIERQLKCEIMSQQLAEQALKEGGVDLMSDRVFAAVEQYLQYATLSHTWGDCEASYGDITSNVFDTKHFPGTFKVQNFCTTVRKLGFRWAWCDTCCIDKSDSSELQETINSMFTWYRNSAITIVYLSDVSTSSQSVLKQSRWFTRGWTLQELLAPRVMQLYNSNWTVYRARYYNHKHDYRLMGALQRITGIPMMSLVDFNPGAHNVREKMTWASSRTTTLVEDMTYSLAGLFDIALPICYGEGNKAFDRLQSEIISRTGDTSLFDWAGESSSLNTCLASQPSCFGEPSLLYPASPTTRVFDETRPGATCALLEMSGHYLSTGLLSAFLQVFKVDRLHRTSSKDLEDGVHSYRIESRGLEPVDIETSWNIQGDDDDRGETVVPTYFLGRFLSASSFPSQGDETQPPHFPATVSAEVNHVPSHMTTPFVAVLLKSTGGEYLQRVGAEKRIVAYPGMDWELHSDIQYLRLC